MLGENERFRQLLLQVSEESSATDKDNRDAVSSRIADLVAIITARDSKAWLEKQVADFSGGLLEHAKARLARPQVENEESLARAQRDYAERLKILAEARKINAEAAALEWKLKAEQLRCLLLVAKARTVGTEREVFLGNALKILLERANEPNDSEEQNTRNAMLPPSEPL